MVVSENVVEMTCYMISNVKCSTVHCVQNHKHISQFENSSTVYFCFPVEDILWFKPVELRTKHGRRGHIKEPLGK